MPVFPLGSHSGSEKSQGDGPERRNRSPPGCSRAAAPGPLSRHIFPLVFRVPREKNAPKAKEKHVSKLNTLFSTNWGKLKHIQQMQVVWGYLPFGGGFRRYPKGPPHGSSVSNPHFPLAIWWPPFSQQMLVHIDRCSDLGVCVCVCLTFRNSGYTFNKGSPKLAGKNKRPRKARRAASWVAPPPSPKVGCSLKVENA